MNNAHEYPKPVRVLIVDDVPNELEQALAEIAGSEFAFTFRAAHTLEDLWCGLDWQPDLILCADLLQRFDVYHALEALTLRGLDIPLVVLATELTDDKVRTLIKKGAADVIAKDANDRLAISIKNALRLSLLRSEKRRLLDALRQSEASFRDVT